MDFENVTATHAILYRATFVSVALGVFLGSIFQHMVK